MLTHPCADLCTVLLLWAAWVQSTWPHSSRPDRPAERGGSSREEGEQNEPVTTLSSGLGRCDKAQRGQGLVHSHCGSKRVSLPVMPEQDSSTKCWAHPDSVCVRSSGRSWRSQDKSLARGGKREAKPPKNSQWPAKAYWGPDAVHALRRRAPLWEAQWECTQSV